ncbi:Putative disease resistance protein [Morus notabilis]|uniref:ADP-ribosyl cyclase/cyclic ADP-ribose hydrolase n=1 Tax=Morus notabilis TaxID=981085 RepID=W9S220_9ROSA|nr:disease resistance-like protein DSC1 [Morus notabilis]EXC10454.1 Putative disease resistance protein [Morus notabilis]
MPYSRPDFSKLVGIEEHVERLERSLHIGTPFFRIIGIWGMIGIGKTTIATVLYDRIYPHFEGFYFLRNVTQKAERHGLDHLRNTLLAQLLGETNLNLGHQSSGSTSIGGRLCHKKVLVVLDGVDDEDQFDQLLPREHIDFHTESRIIVTTRRAQVLRSIRASEEYRVDELNAFDALKLFNLNAFENNPIKSDFADLSVKVVNNHAGGVPLALKLLGSYLGRRISREAWESALEKWEFVPNENILKAYRICYDSLHPTSRNICLDIACFFRGDERNFIERILHGCKFFPKDGISDLIDNCLLISTPDNKISMHDLLQRMAQEIVREESEREPENRSRLWIAEDICDVLEKSMGTAKLEGMFLDMAKSEREKLIIPYKAFSNMRNLRLLKIHDSRSVEVCKVHIPCGLESLPNSLVYFHWHSYPWNSLPSTFAPNGLVELNMPYSKLGNLWPTGVQHLGNLKRINLSYSERLSRIPDLSRARNIESINLESCRSLLELPSYVSNLDKLTSLNLKGCSSLRNCYAFPRNIKSLDVRNCTKLQTLPNNVCDLEHLWYLNLSGCCQLVNFPEISRPMKRLEYLKLKRTSIIELPGSIKNLLGLKVLSLKMCKNLQALPSSISCISTLQKLKLCHCSNLKSLPKLPTSVSWVDARYCSLLESVSISKAELRDVWNKFVFYNCLKLDPVSRNNIMADARLRILRSAVMAREDGESKTPDDEICFPGEKIPEWFEHQNDGHEINVELDHQPDWCNQYFLGFAFCAVVEFQNVSSDTDFQLHCKSECIFPDGKTNKWSRSWTWHWNYLEEESSTMNSSHIFLFHDYCCKTYWKFPINCEASSSTSKLTTYYDKSSATFSFHPGDSRGRVSSLNCEVQFCGVHLLYTHDSGQFRDFENSPWETHRMMSIEERGCLAPAPNDFQRRPISCDC